MPANPDADHLIGERVTGPAVNSRTPGEPITDYVAHIVRWTPDGRSLVVELENGHRVALARSLVEASERHPRKG